MDVRAELKKANQLTPFQLIQINGNRLLALEKRKNNEQSTEAGKRPKIAEKHNIGITL